MQIRSVAHLGQLARSRRLELDRSQAAVAAAAGVSRQWVVAFEAGKETVELGNVLRVLRVLDLAVDLAPRTIAAPAIDLERLVGG